MCTAATRFSYSYTCTCTYYRVMLVLVLVSYLYQVPTKYEVRSVRLSSPRFCVLGEPYRKIRVSSGLRIIDRRLSQDDE